MKHVLVELSGKKSVISLLEFLNTGIDKTDYSFHFVVVDLPCKIYIDTLLELGEILKAHMESNGYTIESMQYMSDIRDLWYSAGPIDDEHPCVRCNATYSAILEHMYKVLDCELLICGNDTHNILNGGMSIYCIDDSKDSEAYTSFITTYDLPSIEYPLCCADLSSPCTKPGYTDMINVHTGERSYTEMINFLKENAEQYLHIENGGVDSGI